MKKATALKQLKAAALEVMAYDTLYPDWVPTNVLPFIEAAQDRYSKAESRAMDYCTMKEIDYAYAEIGFNQ
jgi:hypothetical protein